MNSYNAIGGYFGLELSNSTASYHLNATALNSARNSFEYILKAYRPTKVYISKYNCDVILEPLQKEGVEYEFYSLSTDLELTSLPKLHEKELLLYVDYFGIKDVYAHYLADIYANKLVVDASQAFYYKQHNREQVFYSPRKFFGVADGGYVTTDLHLDEELPMDASYDRMSHLLKRIEASPESGFEDYKRNEHSLDSQPIKRMSHITQRLLGSVDYDNVRSQRNKNASILHSSLGKKNELGVDLSMTGAPLVYPFMSSDATKIRNTLISHRIFVPMYWPNVFLWCREDEVEFALARDILALPIDQRYNEEDMERILKVLHES